MPISIKNDETEQLVRQLAEFTGETITVAVPRRDELREIAMRCAKRPLLAQMTDDEILGYEESGVPSE